MKMSSHKMVQPPLSVMFSCVASLQAQEIFENIDSGLQPEIGKLDCSLASKLEKKWPRLGKLESVNVVKIEFNT